MYNSTTVLVLAVGVGGVLPALDAGRLGAGVAWSASALWLCAWPLPLPTDSSLVARYTHSGVAVAVKRKRKVEDQPRDQPGR